MREFVILMSLAVILAMAIGVVIWLVSLPFGLPWPIAVWLGFLTIFVGAPMGSRLYFIAFPGDGTGLGRRLVNVCIEAAQCVLLVVGLNAAAFLIVAGVAFSTGGKGTPRGDPRNAAAAR